MRQVLFQIPLKPWPWLPSWWPEEMPLHGFGVMLALTLLVCTWLATRRARREGIPPHLIQDLAIWIFVGGLLGARVVYVIQFWDQFQGEHVPWYQFLMIWQGGIVFYGSAVGGVIGYLLAYCFQLRKYRVSTWQMADIIAPAAAVGLCLGRIGCFLNGCCYGNVACADCWGVQYPLPSPARYSLVAQGLQTAAGFTVAPGGGPPVVAAVEPGSPADQAGLRGGDVIIGADGKAINDAVDLSHHIREEWPRGRNNLALTVRRAGAEMALAPFAPRTLPLHPTQLYESISTLLLFLFLMALAPLRRRPGVLMVVFAGGYAVHRFLDEVLRNDTPPVALGMTLSQWGSLVCLVVALGLGAWLWKYPATSGEPAAPGVAA